MRFFKEIPSYDFIGRRKFAYAFSAALLLLALVAYALTGVKWGIDFSGGVLVQARFAAAPPLSEIRSKLTEEFGNGVNVTSFGEANDHEVLINLPMEVMTHHGAKLQEAMTSLLKTHFPSFAEVRRVEAVGPKVGAELKVKAIEAGLFTLAGILLYVGVRFRFSYAIGAVAALFHDVLITMGFFFLLGKEFDLTIVAAMLTIMGYSLNDTIVVFDRIRENVARLPKSHLANTINLSVNETLSRTILTSGTTLIVVVAMFTFGGQIIHDFCFAMLIGLFVGTFSSIFVASPLMLALEKRFA